MGHRQQHGHPDTRRHTRMHARARAHIQKGGEEVGIRWVERGRVKG